MIKYIGIPFVDGGRTLEGADCFGLLKIFYNNEFNIDVPDTRIKPDQPRRIFANYLKEISEHWEETEALEKGTVVAMAMNPNHPKLVTHFGIMIDDKRLLHTLKKCESHITTLDNPAIKNTIKGYYKWYH